MLKHLPQQTFWYWLFWITYIWKTKWFWFESVLDSFIDWPLPSPAEFIPCTWSVPPSVHHLLLDASCFVFALSHYICKPLEGMDCIYQTTFFSSLALSTVLWNLCCLIAWSPGQVVLSSSSLTKFFRLAALSVFNQLLQVKYNSVWKKGRVSGVCFSMQMLFYFYIYILMTCRLNCLLYLEFNCYMTWVKFLKLRIWTPNQSELH